MLIIFSIYGIAINGFIKQLKVTIRTSGYDIIWFGIVYTTVYSQLFSIFYKVGKTAFCILAVIALILVFIFRYKYISVAEQISKKIIIPRGGYYCRCLYSIHWTFVYALNVLFPVDMMDSCEEIMIQDWYGALYKKDDTAYLCWTYDP